MEKEKYTPPELSVFVFEKVDVLLASGDTFKDDGFGTDVPDFND